MAASDHFMSDRMKREFLDRKYGKQTETEQSNEALTYGGVPLSEYVRNEQTQENAMSLQKLKNQGQTDVQGLRNVGSLDVTNANIGEGGRQFNMTNRLNKRKFGLNERKFGETKAQNLRDFERNKNKDKLAEYTQIGGMANSDGMGYSSEATGNALAGLAIYKGSQGMAGDNDSMDLSIRQAVSSGQPLSEAQSNYVRAQNQGQQTQRQQTQTGVPGPLGMQGQGVVAPVTPKLNQRETNESIYGSNPTLEEIWDIDAKRKAARDERRKSQWTVPY